VTWVVIRQPIVLGETMPHKPFSELVLNKSACDWVTLSSWHIDAFDGLMVDPENAKRESRLNYQGIREGKLFIGVGQQGEYLHKLLQVSGAESDLWMHALLIADLPDITCTHLDLQVTVEWPTSDLYALTGRILKAGGSSDFRHDPRSQCDTCYIGSRLSDRFIRVYHKSKDKGIVRFEVAYKKPFARAMWEHMAERMPCDDGTWRVAQMRTWLRYELERTGDTDLLEAFGPVLQEEPEKPPKFIPRPENDTERWLRKIVAPALLRYRNGHDCDEYLIDHLLRILEGAEVKINAVTGEIS